LNFFPAFTVKKVESIRVNVRRKSNMSPSPSVPDATWKQPLAQLFIRLAVGGVFLSEGIQKFLFSDSLGVGRFIKIGIPAPELMAPFVGIVEIGCGCLLLLGLFTRLAAIPLIIDMLVAISTTKIPILLEKGFWAMAHEARVDWTMLLGSLSILLLGGGVWTLDTLMKRPHDGAESIPRA
jgi:putative oxidoreductase